MVECPVAHPLLPPLPECVETGLCEILSVHGDSEATVGIEFQKERLGEEWNARLIGHIDKENCAACAMLFHEIRCFGFELGKNVLNDCAGFPGANKAVEGLVW